VQAASSQRVIIDAEQQRQLEDLWFRFGNNRSEHTMGNHKFIQRLLDSDGLWEESFYKPTQACLDAVVAIVGRPQAERESEARA
jgi:hypothetical protein